MRADVLCGNTRRQLYPLLSRNPETKLRCSAQHDRGLMRYVRGAGGGPDGFTAPPPLPPPLPFTSVGHSRLYVYTHVKVTT